jgi:uncharacterized membrane protein YkvA (DUF1232 family)
MFKPRLNRKQKEVLIDLIVLMADLEPGITSEKLDLIDVLKEQYNVKVFNYTRCTIEEMRDRLESMGDKDRFNILSYAILTALEKDLTPREKRVLQAYFDMISLEDALKMQKLVDKYGQVTFDVKTLYVKDSASNSVLDESIMMLEEYKDKSEEDIDETLLMKMKRGPIKKVWTEVMKLWEAVKDPKSDKAMKALSIGALLYLISPLDVIPDVIPILGLTDDAGIIIYAMTQINKFRQLKGQDKER